MKTTWTEPQKQVIEHRDGNLLVAAAAGSGKTAVLVEHVIRRLTDPTNPVSLQDLVVMTFTKAAAQEMRERIRQALDEALMLHPDDAFLLREAGNIQNAYITTIDSFCKQLITENYASIGLDPGFRMGDDGELNLLKSDLIQDLLEEKYQEGVPEFLRFMDRFATGKTDDNIGKLILEIYRNAEARPWPEEYLEKLSGETEAGEPEWKRYYTRFLKNQIESICQRFRYGLDICQSPDGPEAYIPNFEREIEGLMRLMEFPETAELSDYAEAAGHISFDRLKSTKSPRKEEAKKYREEAKDFVKKLQKLCLTLPEELEQKMEKGIRENLQVLIDLTRDFMQRFREEKEQRHILDFSDLEHKALEMLYSGNGEERRFSTLADDYAHRFKEILVDEYQDSNYVQEELIKALSAERFGRPDVFQVGDVKQSIYAFRQACPELFLEKYDDAAYPTIELSQNFRSRYEVLHAVNDVFFRIMQKSVGGIRYTEETALHPGRPDAVKMMQGNTEEMPLTPHLMLVEEDKERSKELFNGQELSKEELESYMIAQKIRKLHEQGVAYRDIVILMRSPNAWADTCVDILGKEGVPAYCTSNKGYFSTTEVETVLSLLQVIDNPEQDIPLAAVMHSPIYNFTDEELAEIVAAQGSLRCPVMGQNEDVLSGDTDRLPEADRLSPELREKLENFYDSINRFRIASQYLHIHELLYKIYDETGYYHYASAMPAGRRRKANLDALIDSAMNFEKTSYKGLFDYIRYIEKLKKYENDEGEASVYSEQDDLVRIISMHKSKGLQFKVVFLSGLGRPFNEMDQRKEIMMDDRLGIGCNYVEPERKIKIPSLQKEVIKIKKNIDSKGEELRILYVGMTRAEEQLYLTGTVKDMEKALSAYSNVSAPLSQADILSAKSFADWILMAEGTEKLMRTGSQHGPIILDTYTVEKIAENSRQEIRRELQLEENLYAAMDCVDEETEMYRNAEAHLASVYAHLDAVKLRPKHSVSEIKEMDMEQFEAREAEAGREHWTIQADTDRPVDPDAPGQKTQAAQYREQAGASVGDAYHHAFERYDYGRGIEQLPEILSEAEYSLIRPERFAAFLKTDLAKKFKEAQEQGILFREQHFMKQVRDCDLFPEHTSEEPVLLQGIIDAFILQEDGIILVDYKSDHVRDEATLIGRYKTQLTLYAKALQEITGRPVKEKLIYSIILGKAIAV